MVLELMEICSKNGNLQFHRLLASKEWAEIFLLILKKVKYIS